MSPLDVLSAPLAPIKLSDHFDFQQVEVRGVPLAADAVARARVAAASAVGSLRGAAAPAIPFLIEMLDQDRVSAVADHVVQAFQSGSATTDDGHQAENMANLSEADLACQVAASDALASIGSLAVPALTQALTGSRPNRRSGAAKALGKIGAPAEPALAVLNHLAKADPAETVRQAAAEAARLIKPRKWFSF